MATLEELRVLRILQEHSDEEHRLQQKEIRRLFRQHFGEEIGVKPLRRILRDLAALEESVECAEKERARNEADGATSEQTMLSDFYMQHLFSDEELRLLIDAVSFMPHLPSSFGKEMTAKLMSLASRYFQPRCVLSDPSVRHNHELLLSVGTLDKAIRMNRKVKLKYLKHELDGQQTVRRDSKGRERVHVISPYQFAMSNGSYYIICNNNRFDNLAHYRVDRMRDVQIMSAQRRPLSEICPGSRDLDDEMLSYCQQHAYMFHGDPVRAELLADSSAVSHLIDTFGDNVTLSQDGERVKAEIRAVPESILQFARSFSPHVSVLSPPTLREQARQDLREGLTLYDD